MWRFPSLKTRYKIPTQKRGVLKKVSLGLFMCMIITEKQLSSTYTSNLDTSTAQKKEIIQHILYLIMPNLEGVLVKIICGHV